MTNPVNWPCRIAVCWKCKACEAVREQTQHLDLGMTPLRPEWLPLGWSYVGGIVLCDKHQLIWDVAWDQLTINTIREFAGLPPLVGSLANLKVVDIAAGLRPEPPAPPPETQKLLGWEELTDERSNNTYYRAWSWAQPTKAYRIRPVLYNNEIYYQQDHDDSLPESDRRKIHWGSLAELKKVVQRIEDKLAATPAA